MQLCLKVSVNLFSLMCKLLQRKTISSNYQNNIVVKSMDGNIIPYWQIKTCDHCISRVEFLQETSDERAQSAIASLKKNINNLHIELGHSSESITHTITKALSIKVAGIFMPCEDCTLGIAKQQVVTKKGCSIKNFGREAFLWHKLSFYSQFWWYEALATCHRQQ